MVASHHIWIVFVKNDTEEKKCEGEKMETIMNTIQIQLNKKAAIR